MFGEVIYLLTGLLMIFLAAEVFTNGIENLGRRLSLSQAVVGSLLAAVGTALPETILPIVAIFFYGGEAAKDIGVGAILGAPFMLSTLAFFLVGITIIISYIGRRRKFEINVETHSTKRDFIFFLPMYSMAVLMPIVAGESFSTPIAIILIAGYILYAYLTFRGESADIDHSEVMYLLRILRRLGLVSSQKPHLVLALFQVAVALAIMVAGAHTFVKSLEHVSVELGISPLLFALLLAPVATELPEKFNSITWVWKGKDTLAIGNITGAMVFQATFPVSIGLLFTPWKITGLALFSAIIALSSAIIVLGELIFRKRISPVTLLLGGGLYLVYAYALLRT
ncbi:MAG: sodium:calcium antiporter [Nitrospirota bacterium]